ncbi:MAG: hypothetical protein IT445_06375 [Phycisphaeraceae bacterium]|nr:hypothetical protein [Phycisphaeraceae bacterium]
MKPRVVAILMQDESPTLIVRDGESCRAIPITVAAETDAKGVVAEIRRTAEEAGAVLKELVLAIPSDACLAATISTEGLHRGQRRSGMLYRLEEYLPKDAEQLTADFIAHETHALGVAVETSRMLPLLEALDNEAIRVCALVPTAILVAQTAIRDKGIADGTLLLLVEDGFDWFVVEGGQPLRWTCGRHNGFDLSLQFKPPEVSLSPQVSDNVTELPGSAPSDTTLPGAEEEIPGTSPSILSGLPEAPARIAISPDPPGLPAFFKQPMEHPHRSEADLPGVWVYADGQGVVEASQESWRDWQAHVIVRDTSQLIGEAAERIARQGFAAYIDLRRGQLARGDRIHRVQTPFYAAVAATIVLLLSICATSLWRGHQYTLMVQEMQNSQQELFHQAFPDQKVPAGIVARLRSEHRKLAAMSGQGEQLPDWHSSLDSLHRTLTSIAYLMGGHTFGAPGSSKGSKGGEGLRFRVLELRLDRDDLYLDGQARSHSDADRIASTMRSDGQFVIDPPRTENLPDKGIAFTLVGKLNSAMVSPAPEKPPPMPPDTEVEVGLVKGGAP